MAVTDGGADDSDLPELIRDTDMETVIGTDGVAYTWERATPDEVRISVTTQHQDQALTVAAGDTIVGPNGEPRCTVEGLSVWSTSVGNWYVDICVLNEYSERIPYNPADFAATFLGDEAKPIEEVYELDVCKALSDEEFEVEQWAFTVDQLKSLDEGERVLWGDRSEPLTVVDTGLAFSEYVYLDGPRGGQYAIEWETDIPTVRRPHERGKSLGQPYEFRVLPADDSDS